MADHKVVANAIERNHIINLLETNRRIDGRNKSDVRDIKFELDVVSTAHGSAIVHLGDTKVICGVKAVMSTPWSDYPNKGSIFVGFEANPLSSPEYKSGPPQDYEIELARMTDRAVRESECVNLEDLCLIEGEKSWTLNIDLYTLDDYGNLFDACVLAAIAALSTTKIPETEIVDGQVNILDTVRPIKIDSYPISVTTYKIGDHLVTDAEFREEQIADARISFGTTQHYIVSGQKGGEGSFKSDEVISSLKSAIQKASVMRQQLWDTLGISP
ncbi:MAG: exosome complex protein Rrp42 [Candidatus Heimdallarchaeota archaeon]|nr:exosome complex protein Rrp42 [Candidatus Heimdallarchaeota archaeon]